MRITYITGSEHTWNTRTRRAFFRKNISYFISLHIGTENVTVGTMANSQKKSINGNIVMFLVRLAEPFHQMCTFNAIFTKQAFDIMFKQHLNLGIIKHTSLHDFAGTQVVLSHDKVYFAGQTSQIRSLLASCVTATDDSNRFTPIEEAITGSTGTHTHTRIFFLIFKTQVFCGSSGSNDEGIRFDYSAILNGHMIGGGTEVSTDSQSAAYLCTKTFGLTTKVFHHLRTGNTLGITGEIFHLSSRG